MEPEFWLRRVIANIVASFVVGGFGGVIVKMTEFSDWAGTTIAVVTVGCFSALEILHWADLIQTRG